MEHVGVTWRTLMVWWSDDLVKEYCQQLAENIEQEFAIQLAGAGLGAMRALSDMLELPTATMEGTLHADTKIVIARELLDRMPQTATIRDRNAAAANDDAGTLVQIINGMPDSELSAFIASWKAKGGDGADSPALIEG